MKTLISKTYLKKIHSLATEYADEYASQFKR